MKKILLLCVGMLFITLPLQSENGTNSTSDNQTTFNKVRTAFYDTTPLKFMAQVTGEDIKKEINSIPADQKGANPVVWFFLKRDCEPFHKILIQDVHEIHTTRLEQYLIMFESFSQFLNPTTTYEKFTTAYEWKVLYSDSTSITVKMRYKNRSENNYFLIYFNTSDLLISKGEQYVDGTKRGELSVVYGTIGDKKVPTKLFGKATVYEDETPETRHFVFKLSSHNTQVALTCTDFLDEEKLLSKAPKASGK